LNGPGKWRWVVPAALVVALALSGSTFAAPVGQISEFPTPTANSSPEGIVAGPDGNLWFAELGANRIGEVDPTTGVIAEFPVPTAGGGPLGVAVGPDGNIWFTEFFAGKVGEINPVTHAISDFAIPTASSGPIAIVEGANGNMWFTEGNGNKVAEINPVSDAITEFPVPTPASGPFGIAAGPDGDIWFTEKTASKIAVVSLATNAISEIATPTASSMPNAIAAGPSGSVWFTESAAAVSKIGLVNTATHATSDFPTLTSSSSPTVIAPGPDANMWFTESGAPGKIGVINAVTHVVTNEFETHTASSNPLGIATGADGNLWFTELANPGMVGAISAGAPAAEVTAPAVSGTLQPGNTLSCEPAAWSNWAGEQPSTDAFGWDGFRWLLDGTAIAGATAQTLSVSAADIGHGISCTETATYLLVGATVPAASPAVTISPSLGALLGSTSTTPTTVSLTISCQGLPTQTCSGPITLTSHVTTQGSKILAVAATTRKKPKPKPKPKPKKVTKVETIATGSYSVGAGQSTTVKLTLNSTGKKVLTARYKVPATLTVSGTSSLSKTVTLSYGRLHIVPAYQWAFSKTFAFATQLTLGGLPRGSRVALLCHGHGCPFSKRTFAAPKHGKLQVAPALKQRHLAIHSTVALQITATNVVGEVVRFTVVPGKLPRETFLCLPPGAHTSSACVR
jgi:streptogramin lyase